MITARSKTSDPGDDRPLPGPERPPSTSTRPLSPGVRLMTSARPPCPCRGRRPGTARPGRALDQFRVQPLGLDHTDTVDCAGRRPDRAQRGGPVSGSASTPSRCSSGCPSCRSRCTRSRWRQPSIGCTTVTGQRACITRWMLVEPSTCGSRRAHGCPRPAGPRRAIRGGARLPASPSRRGRARRAADRPTRGQPHRPRRGTLSSCWLRRVLRSRSTSGEPTTLTSAHNSGTR
jgi:hypothetical protein